MTRRTRMLNQLIHLIKTKALSKGQFKLSSGQISDYYIDLSKVVLNSRGLATISSLIIDEIVALPDAIGGPAYGAISIISGVLTKLNNPDIDGFYYRKEAKTYGKQDFLEGNLFVGDSVILVEDVITTGQSLLKIVEEVKKVNCKILQTISIVDRNQGAAELFKEKNIPFKSLLNINQIL